jgi:uncharacterized protein
LDSLKQLIIVLASGSEDAPEPALLAFRYALTARALDIEVELHVVGQSVGLLRKSAIGQGGNDSGQLSVQLSVQISAQISEMKDMGVKLFACSAALRDAGISSAELIAEVSGIRGAAALLSAGFASETRLMTF